MFGAGARGLSFQPRGTTQNCRIAGAAESLGGQQGDPRRVREVFRSSPQRLCPVHAAEFRLLVQ